MIRVAEDIFPFAPSEAHQDVLRSPGEQPRLLDRSVAELPGIHPGGQLRKVDRQRGIGGTHHRARLCHGSVAQ
jgi:hypothetical protein